MTATPGVERVRLLWTGGWDSTFQLLQLLLIQKVRVIPIYLIPASRPSTGAELQTMARIKTALIEKYPHVSELLEPTVYYDMMDIQPDDDIEQAMSTLHGTHHMGKQYLWFARYCKQFSVDHLQLGVHRFDCKGHMQAILEPYMTEVSQGGCRVHRIDDKHHGTAVHTLFRYFTFPIINLSKLQMAKIAEERGWMHEMRMTWFCFHPKPTRQGVIPCGRCCSCRDVTDSGIGWRIPLRRRLPAFCKKSLRKFTYPTRRYLKGLLFNW